MDKKQNNGKRSIINILLIAGLFSAISAVLAGCASENISTYNKTWKPLFNGRDLMGWSVKCKPADRDEHFWKVEN